MENEGRRLASLVGAGVAKSRQRQLLLWTEGAALAAGLLLSPVLMRSLPVTPSSHVAAFLLKEDRWHAGETLMQLNSSGQWPGAIEAVRLARGNEVALAGCRSQAIKTGREQRCAIVVPAQ